MHGPLMEKLIITREPRIPYLTVLFLTDSNVKQGTSFRVPAMTIKGKGELINIVVRTEPNAILVHQLCSLCCQPARPETVTFSKDWITTKKMLGEASLTCPNIVDKFYQYWMPNGWQEDLFNFLNTMMAYYKKNYEFDQFCLCVSLFDRALSDSKDKDYIQSSAAATICTPKRVREWCKR